MFELSNISYNLFLAPGPALPQPALDVPVHSQDLVRPSLHTLERPLTSAQPHGTDQPLAFSKPSDQLNPARMSTLSLPGGPTGHVAEGGPSPTDTEGVQYEGCAGQDYGLPNPPEVSTIACTVYCSSFRQWPLFSTYSVQ